MERSRDICQLLIDCTDFIFGQQESINSGPWEQNLQDNKGKCRVKRSFSGFESALKIPNILLLKIPLPIPAANLRPSIARRLQMGLNPRFQLPQYSQIVL